MLLHYVWHKKEYRKRKGDNMWDENGFWSETKFLKTRYCNLILTYGTDILLPVNVAVLVHVI